MVRNIGIVALLLFVVVVHFGQSGRRAAATPTPIPKAEDADTFSESKPGTKRPMRISPASAVSGQSAGNAGQTSQTNIDDENAIKVETNLITIPVSVFDRNGLYIPNLQQKEFKIFEDGVEQTIAYFGTSDKPFTVALLLDTSPSTQYRIEEIRAGAKAFVEQLKAQDRVMVIEFDSSIKVRCELTSDRAAIFKGIDKANFGNGTSIYDAVDRTLKRYLKNVEGRKAIVLFTDGVDTTSSRSTYDSTLAYAEESDILIFPIYFNTFYENRRSSQQWPRSNWPFPSIPVIGAGTTAQEYAIGKKYVEDLAEYTGGRVFRPESTPGGLTRAFEGIAEELRRQYSIGYVPKDDGTPGQRKQIKVRVNRPNLIVRARDSYIVGISK